MSQPASRRAFLHTSLATAFSSILSTTAADGRAPRIILRSSWATGNIGDIAHTPGVLALIEKYIPGAEVRLWPNSVDNGVDQLLLRRFPKLLIMDGSEASIQSALQECDFFLHGSGPSFLGRRELARWHIETGKPYGIYGITIAFVRKGKQKLPDRPDQTFTELELFNQAKFAYFRDPGSLQVAKDAGVTCPIAAFGLDGAFATDLSNDAAADAFLKAHDLEAGKFLCVIGRMRFTPRWWTNPDLPVNVENNQRNEERKEHDHKQLRAAITEITRNTAMKILICPEDRTQMRVGKELLYDPLPDDVKAKVVWRDEYWLTDEALSTYRRSAGLFGNEMHSPIMCIGHGIPAIVCRWQEQTSKGLMWREIGLGDWLFDTDDEKDYQGIVPACLALATDPEGSRQKALAAQARVQELQKVTMAKLKENLAI